MEKYWIGRRVELLNNKLNIYVYDDSVFLFDGNNREEWVKLSRIKQDFERDKILDKPFKVSSGVLLITNDNHYLFYIRDPDSYIYPGKIQYFSGHVKYREYIFRNAIRNFVRETFIWNESPVKIKFDGVWDSVMDEIFSKSLHKATLIPAIPPEIINKEPVFINAKNTKICDQRKLTINMFINNELIERSKGYFSYDENTNTIEIVYPYKLEVNVGDIKMISIDSISNPVISISEEVLNSVRKEFFSKNTHVIIDMIHNCLPEYY